MGTKNRKKILDHNLTFVGVDEWRSISDFYLVIWAFESALYPSTTQNGILIDKQEGFPLN